jgi:hypothetical protein
LADKYLLRAAGQSPQAAEQAEQQVQPEHLQQPADRHICPHTSSFFVIS